MAFVLTSRTATFTLRDNNGKVAQFSLYYPSNAAPGDVVGSVDTLRPILAALSDAAITAASVSFSWTETAPATPNPSSEIERRLMLVGRATNGGIVKYSVPSPLFTLESDPGTDRVSLTQAPVANLIAFLTGNAGSIVGSPVQSITSGYIMHRYRQPKK